MPYKELANVFIKKTLMAQRKKKAAQQAWRKQKIFKKLTQLKK